MKLFVAVLLICNIIYIVNCSGAEGNGEKTEDMPGAKIQTEQKKKQAIVPEVTRKKNTHQSSRRRLKGRIIDITDSYITVKKGRTEIKLVYAESIKVIYENGNKGSVKDLEVCQYVHVRYKRGKSNYLVYEIIIEKASDCYK